MASKQARPKQKRPTLRRPRKLVGRRKVSAVVLEEAREATRKSIPCAFCKGKGRDPYPVLSALSTCPVCHGRGSVYVREPFETCGACQGTGIYYRSHLYCWNCRGKGVVTV